ncbi:MBL fold metallo-hydrolase [Roseomonas marmotae]|uniref:MBL fold metallo-hydrolase n=1 Tax=Roseomonas marmotae TaxID=2768161 RepID=A0ABS3KGJ4_9PROT|nr:MBL fold metallo-hydrolase [Roseomonas marmotae]MBO1076097.1 MBL fold metallo-hydrolase [Roseomonas marmotae]QTI81333.1 MBL fold metallo-hydrolase [Roseomonas marmotae]
MRRRPIIAALLAVLAASPAAALAHEARLSAPRVLPQVSGLYRFQAGEVRITALSDGSVPQDLHKLLLGTTEVRTDALLAQSYLTNPVEASINVYLLEMGDRRILVDAGAGEMFGPGMGGKLIANLALAGVRPGQITDILITHVHTDHTGGLVKAGAAVFENATVHLGKPDIDFFMDPSNATKAHYDIRYFEEAITALKPYLDAGKIRTFAATEEILPGITATLHPGHTPGSAFYTLRSMDQRIVFIGDLIHVSSVQFPEPDITIVYDVDPKKAAERRVEQFSLFARDGELVAAPHLPFPGIGHVRAAQRGFAWVPVEYGDRDAR